ncbi:MAG TPA: hypothetical protein VJQ58_02590 [Burkholderiales bacterium]|nr:hypothetical protein [Burkholderiales bacterium]
MKLTYEDILKDPSLLERIRTDARRERSKEMRRLFGQLKNLFSSHAARPHLARQG